MLTTREGHRRRGLARAVLIRLIEELCALGRFPLFCYVVESNAPSRALLESLGFEATGVYCWQRWER
jgi:predicted GNAT family acetyltransferase